VVEVVAACLRPLAERPDLAVNRLIALLPTCGHAGIDGHSHRPLPRPARPWHPSPRPTRGAAAGLSAPPAAARPGRRRTPTRSTPRGRADPGLPGTWP